MRCSAQNKLFIAPVVADREAFLRVLREPALHCSGKVYLAMVSKPKACPASADEIGLWRFEEGEWIEP